MKASQFSCSPAAPSNPYMHVRTLRNSDTDNYYGWTRGRPASPGWYTASFERDPACERYWHGTHWSAPVYYGDPPGHFQRAKNARGETQSGIEYRSRIPMRERLLFRALARDAHAQA